MDRVRLGRVLGHGARMAARTAMEAMDAATAPEPVTSRSSNRNTISAPTILPPVRVSTAHVANAAKAASAARAGVMTPLKNASRALWHELTGSFFALFAVSFGIAVWRTRTHAVSAVANDRYRFYAFCVLALLFAYFSVSSFLRARKRG